MARQLVTQALINAAASDLLAEGSEVTAINLRTRIGGGSYTSINRCLDEWRATADAPAHTTPAEIDAKGQEFIRAIWALASRQAQSEVQSIRAQADIDTAALRRELSEAATEITRLENVESQHTALIEQLGGQLQAAEVVVAETRVEARRAAGLEKSLLECGSELKAARRETADKAVEVGKLIGEVEALRTQSRELIAAVNLKNAKK